MATTPARGTRDSLSVTPGKRHVAIAEFSMMEIIDENSASFKLELPTKAPSTVGLPTIWPMLFAFVLPP